jgi:LysM domain
MNQRSSVPARATAVVALLCGFVLVIGIVAASLGDGDGGDGGSDGRAQPTRMAKGERRGGEAPKSYVVQNGDTLTSIAQKTGVTVARIQELNPGVDPQILVSGEKLKLR